MTPNRIQRTLYFVIFDNSGWFFLQFCMSGTMFHKIHHNINYIMLLVMQILLFTRQKIPIFDGLMTITRSETLFKKTWKHIISLYHWGFVNLMSKSDPETPTKVGGGTHSICRVEPLKVWDNLNYWFPHYISLEITIKFT